MIGIQRPKNRELLRETEDAGYDVLLAIDEGVPRQQDLAARTRDPNGSGPVRGHSKLNTPRAKAILNLIRSGLFWNHGPIGNNPPRHDLALLQHPVRPRNRPPANQNLVDFPACQIVSHKSCTFFSKFFYSLFSVCYGEDDQLWAVLSGRNSQILCSTHNRKQVKNTKSRDAIPAFCFFGGPKWES